MSQSSKPAKQKRQSASKQVAAQKQKISVMNITLRRSKRGSKGDAVRRVTVTKQSRPMNRYAALKPWLELANGDCGPDLRIKTLVLSLGIPELKTALERSLKASFESLLSVRQRLHDDLGCLERYRGVGMKLGPTFNLPAWDTADFPLEMGNWGIDVEGFVQRNSASLYEAFIEALLGTDVDRFRKCERCERFYYAKRRDQKTCSGRCAGALRAVNWRARQRSYEYNRKLKRAGVEKKRSSEGILTRRPRTNTRRRGALRAADR